MKEEIVYLGFVILVDGLKMNLEKVEAILDWPTSKIFSEVRSFMVWQVFTKISLEISVQFVML